MPTLLIVLLAVLAVLAFGWGRERARRHEAEANHRAEVNRQQERRESELREQGLRTAALFDRMIEGLIVIDASGAIRLANRAAGDLFGFVPPASGRTLLETVRHHEVADVAARLVRESEVLGHEIRLEAVGSARTRFLRINALALRDRAGGPDGAILVFHELTRLRELEAVRQEFVANVSHELRTPLSLIKSAAETLLDGAKDSPPTLERFLEIIDRNANRLMLLIDDLLLLSTLDSGAMRLHLQPVALRSAVQEVIEDFASRTRGATLANDLPPALVAQADPDRLRQVLSNLIDNAIKYGRPGGRVEIRGEVRADGSIELSVGDDGPGIPADALARIFERFYRADKARSREQGGTGLGLAIVKHVVQAHGGEVRVASAVGAGTTFSFTLPRAK